MFQNQLSSDPKIKYQTDGGMMLSNVTVLGVNTAPSSVFVNGISRDFEYSADVKVRTMILIGILWSLQCFMKCFIVVAYFSTSSD